MHRIASRILSRQVLPKAIPFAKTALFPGAQVLKASPLQARFVVPGLAAGSPLARFFSTEVLANKSTVWIGGLPFDTEEDHLRDLFDKYGDITRISMNKRRDGRFIGTAFVEFSNPAEAQAALELDGEACGSRYMKVTIAQPKKPKNVERPENCTSIRFSNVPFNITEEHVRSMFEHCGEITNVFFPKDKNTGRVLGYGFVEFIHPESADKALDVSGADAFGRRINVEYSLRTRPVRNIHKPEGCKSVYVGNLTEDVNSGMLHNLFSDCGEIERVHIAVDRETGEPRGFGYVNFADTDAVDDAIKLSGSVLGGQAIRIAFVRDREHRRPSHEDRHDSGRGFGRTNGERGYGGRAKRGGRDEGRFERRHRD